MKRRRVINQDQNKSGGTTEGQKGSHVTANSGGNQISEPPCMLNTVFEVLLPLEPKIAGKQSFNSTKIGKENSGANMIMNNEQYNFCKKCGGLEDYCKCVGSGDFENIAILKEKKKAKTAKSLSIHSESKETINNKEYETSSQEESTEQSSTIKNDESSCSQASSLETSHEQTSSSEQQEDLFNNSKEDSNSSETKTNSREEENSANLSSNEMLSCTENENSSETRTDIECDNLSTSCEITLVPEKESFENAKDAGDLNIIPKIVNSHSSEPSTNECVLNSSNDLHDQSLQGQVMKTKEEVPSWTANQKYEEIAQRLPSDDGDNLGRDVLQVFEQMDLDDIHLEITPTLDLPLLEELKEADRKSKKTAHLINQIKESIKKFQSKENLTEEDTLVIKIKQVELAKKLAEFEEITRRVQNLVGLAELNNVHHSVTVSKIEDHHESKLQSGSLSESQNEDQQTTQERLDKSENDTSFRQNDEETFHESEGRDESNKIEEMEVIQAQSNYSSLMSDGKLSYMEKDNEVSNFLMMDKIIPKVIVCGSQDSMPRVIVCEKPNQSAPSPSFSNTSQVNSEYVPQFPQYKENSFFNKRTEVPEMMISLSGRLSESYMMQEKLATENAVLEDGRYILQEELLKRDSIVDTLQKKVGCLQSEMRIIAKENIALQEKLEEYNNMDCSCNKWTKATGRTLPPCCGSPQNNSVTLERQLNMIEGEVRNMQNELQQVQKERQQLELRKKHLQFPDANGQIQQKKNIPCVPQTCTCGPNFTGVRGENPEQSLRELQEKYARLEDDFKNKVAEVSALRHELEKWKCKCHSAEEAQESAEAECRCYQSQLKAAEQETKKLVGTKEQMMEQDQQLNLAKQRFREAQDELEELRALIQDQTAQLEDYRNKYLQAQQQVEEQRRQIDVMEMENSRISDQVNLEIQRVKAQFQEKLQELTPLPDILKATQLKLQESQQARALAERNLEDINNEVQAQREQLANLQKEVDDNNLQKAALDGDCLEKLKNLEAKANELRDENARLRSELIRLDEIAAQAQRRLEEKSHDASQLGAQLDTVREESARQVARVKDRAETMRRSLQCQISELERQLAQSRAAARAAQKDRDEIRQRMQCQINNLNESFEQAQMRIKSLQSHVNFLKSSYSNMFEPANAIECACPNFAQEFNY